MKESLYRLNKLKKVMLCRIDKRKLMLSVLSDAEEAQIDESDNIADTKFWDNGETIVPQRDIKCYGSVKVNSEEDMFNIGNIGIVPKTGGYIPSGFNYETKRCITNNGIMTHYPTFNHVLWFKYNYTLIGRPSKIIIYLE